MVKSLDFIWFQIQLFFLNKPEKKYLAVQICFLNYKMNGTDCISKLWESNEVLWTACLTNIYQMLNSISFSTDCYHLVSNASYMYFRVYFIYVHIPPSGGSTKKKKRLYRCSRVLQHNMIGLLNTWTHSGYDNMHRIIQDQVSQNSSMEFCDQGSQGYTKNRKELMKPQP